MKNIICAFICLNILIPCWGQTNIMSEKDLENAIRPQIEKVAKRGWKNAKLDYLVEDSFSEYGLYITKFNGEVFVPSPMEYSLNYNKTEGLNSFIKEHCTLGRCNKIVIQLTPKSFSYELFFIQEKYEHSERMKVDVENKNTVNTIITDKKLEYSRYNKIESKPINSIKVKELPTEAKVFSEFYTRLYSLFGEPSSINYEGFTYKIIDADTKKVFEPSLTGFGASYYAADSSESTRNAIEHFHNMLYSKELELKECELKYGSDFGQITIGYSNGKFIYKEE